MSGPLSAVKGSSGKRGRTWPWARPTSNGGNGLGHRGLANSQATKPSTRHHK